MATNANNFLPGEIYGSYEIIERDSSKKSPHVYWKCKCVHCGKIKSFRSHCIKIQEGMLCKCQQNIEIVGKTFNNFKVLLKTDKRTSNKSILYLCECIHCGSLIELETSVIKKKNKLCPFCQNRKNTLIDLTDEIYGYLKVLKRDESEEHIGHEKDSYWICQCLNCGSIKSIRGVSLRKGLTKSCGCIKSYGEEKISKILNENNIIYQREFSFKDLIYKNPLRFDFAIFKNNGELSHLIEYDGIQHSFFKENGGWNNEENFKKTKLRDKLKDDYCLKNNIKLIRINYDDKITLERIMGKGE